MDRNTQWVRRCLCDSFRSDWPRKSCRNCKTAHPLVDRYLFGSWRKSYTEYGERITEAALLKELNCEDEIMVGCVCAYGLGNKPALKKFLLYLDKDVENSTPESTAFYRLLADWALRRKRWNWEEQSQIVKSQKSAKYIALLDALSALKNNDALKFQHSLSQLRKGSQPTSPITFCSLIETAATFMVMLGEDRGLTLPNPPSKLTDFLLERAVFES